MRVVEIPNDESLRRAAEVVGRALPITPIKAAPDLGAGVVLKLESFQPTGSFKVRGGLAAVAAAERRHPGAPLVAASAGNHGLGVAYAADRLGAKATVVVAETASEAKVQALGRYGSRLLRHGSSYDEAEAFALELAAEQGGRFISPYNDADVIAGQATVGTELLSQVPDVGTVVVPVGGGGLLSGIGLATARAPVRIVGVEPERSTAMGAAFAAGSVVPISVGDTMADGLAGNIEEGSVTVELVRRAAFRVRVGQRGRDRARHGVPGPRARRGGRRFGSRGCGRAALWSPRRRREPDGGPHHRSQRHPECAGIRAGWMTFPCPRVVLDEVTISYESAGEGEPVVLIAGCGAPALAWSVGIAPAIEAAGYQVITFDNRGVAPSSSPPAPYAIGQMVDDTLGLLDHLGLDGPVRIAGHSMGGWIAETIAVEHPGRVRGAALMGSANPPTAWERAITTVERDLARLDFDLPRLFYACETLRYLPNQQLQDDAVVETWLSLIGDLEPWANPGRLGQYEACLAWSTDPARGRAWPTVSVPCLVLAFEHDVDSPPARAREAAAAIPGARYAEIPDASHLGPMTHVDAVSAVLVDFFDGL